jgi:aconitate hydratase
MELRDLPRLPVSLRIVLESLLRNRDGERVRDADVEALASWKPNAPRTAEIPFVVARVLLQDFTGVPLVVDLAAMRSAAMRAGRDAKLIEPLVPVELVADHSVQVDYFGTPDALAKNVDIEMHRNRERYQFLKWGMRAFDGFRIVPPGFGICHQVNLEYLARGIITQNGVTYPDTLVGADSHTTMVNGLGVVGWGVGGIEAEAAMLGQPVYFLTPDVVGVHLHGRLAPGVTATDLVLTVTELLRKTKVVGKFVEYHGEGAASLTVPDRATIANMSPEYGATIGFFPADEQTCAYLAATGRSREHVDAFRAYFSSQGLFGMPRAGAIDYSEVVDLDLSRVEPCVAGPKRPQDRIPLGALKGTFRSSLGARADDPRRKVQVGGHHSWVSGGGQQSPDTVPVGRITEIEMMNNRNTPDCVDGDTPVAVETDLGHGDVLIAAITSCTNTSNPQVMLAAGIVAKKAVARGLRVRPTVKTSLAPGSRVVSEYLAKAGLLEPLGKLGFQLVGYGCTTCIGNSGPIDPALESAIAQNDVVAAAVLSGNRNFEARIHQSIRANFLASPPLVVAFAIAGTVDIDLARDPIAPGVFLRDVWPTPEELAAAMRDAAPPETYRQIYAGAETGDAAWQSIPITGGTAYEWTAESTYIREPPYFTMPPLEPEFRAARALAIFGDSVTTDHISPAGAIKPNSPAGQYLREHGVAPADFNSYGARRGNHEVMMRGTFANVRIKNLMVPGSEGGVTRHQPSGDKMTIFDAAMRYANESVPLVVVAGAEYGTGSSRDWAAKGTRLLGVRAVFAQSFERIHRSNLVGMGVLPCQLDDKLESGGSETFELRDVTLAPRARATLVIDGKREVPVTVRIDTPIEVEYYRAGGILPFVLRRLIATRS